MEILGLDIGGSSIKGAIVDSTNGQLVSERHIIQTPQPATPTAIAQTVNMFVQHFNWTGLVGCSFPTVIYQGKCKTAGNISPEWVDVQIDALFSNACNGLKFSIGNDADLAGIAEISIGAGKGKSGKVIVITIGTGLGSGAFFDGTLIPNFELGRMFHTDGNLIEHYASGAAKTKENLELKEWALRFDFFLNHVARICTPDCLIIGGGLSEQFENFSQWLTGSIPILPAKFKNDAGIIGAAMYANENHKLP